MTGIWSLVFFTLLAQCAVGLSLFIALDHGDRRSATCRTWVAITVLVVGTLISLTHLSQPFISFYSITGVAHSWLSREILFAGLFGATMVAGALFKLPVLRWLAPVVGLAFIFVMSNVYMIANQPQWNSWLTLAAYFTSCVLLGGTAMLLLDMIEGRHDPEAQRLDILGCLPLIIALAAGVRIVVMLAQVSHPEHAFMGETIAHAALLLAGAGPGLLCLCRAAARSGRGQEPAHSGCCLAGTAVIFVLIASAEVCGRLVFYRSFALFGM